MKRIIAALGLAAVMTTGAVTANAQYYTQTNTRPAWSQRGTGAAIGAGGGAVVGAILNRNNPAAGAVVGGLIGAGVGYLVGQNEDRMNPRPRYVQTQTMYDAYGQPIATRTRRTNNPGYRGGNYNRGYNRGYNNNGYYNAGYNNGYYSGRGNGCR
jgi:hypothetical protein